MTEIVMYVDGKRHDYDLTKKFDVKMFKKHVKILLNPRLQ